jgi:hypothetical protein
MPTELYDVKMKNSSSLIVSPNKHVSTDTVPNQFSKVLKSHVPFWGKVYVKIRRQL